MQRVHISDTINIQNVDFFTIGIVLVGYNTLKQYTFCLKCYAK